MKICSRCGREIPDIAKYCPYCAYHVEEDEKNPVRSQDIWNADDSQTERCCKKNRTGDSGSIDFVCEFWFTEATLKEWKNSYPHGGERMERVSTIGVGIPAMIFLAWVCLYCFAEDIKDFLLGKGSESDLRAGIMMLLFGILFVFCAIIVILKNKRGKEKSRSDLFESHGMHQGRDGRPGFWERIRIDESGAEIAYAGKNGANEEATVLKRKWFYYQEVVETPNLLIVQSAENSFRKTQNKEIACKNMKSEYQEEYLSMNLDDDLIIPKKCLGGISVVDMKKWLRKKIAVYQNQG